MSSVIDDPPINDQFVKPNGFLTDVWRDWLARNFQTIASYLSPSGIILPPNTTTQINAIINPQMFSILGNSTTGEPQIYLGSWKNILHS